MSEQHPMNNLGKQIGDTVRSALQSGDLSKLSEIGPAVQGAVKNITTQQGNKEPEGQNNTNGNTGAPPSGDMRTRAPSSSPQRGWPNSGGQGTAPARSNWVGGSKPAVRRGPSNFTGVPAIVLGTLGSTVFGVSALVVASFVLLGMLSAGGGVLAGFLAGGLVGSIAAIAAGSSKRKLAARVRKYYGMLTPKGVCTLEELGYGVGRSAAEVKKDIRKAVAKGMMPDVHFDKGETCVILGQENYKLYLESEKAREEREREETARAARLGDPEQAALEQFREEGARALGQLRAIREDISEASVAAQIQDIETTANKIFSYVQEHPGKLQDTRKLMTYYLPTTLKVLEKYRQYDKMEVQVPSVVRAQNEIEQTLGTVDTAFQNLLESLYHEDTLDVTTDVEVLQAMFRQEGLTGRQFRVDEPEDGFEM